MTPLAILAASATIGLSGYVPPHLANDGRIYDLSLPSGAPVVELTRAFRRCKVDDFRRMSGSSGVNYRFALPIAYAPDVACILANLPEGSRVETAPKWSD